VRVGHAWRTQTRIKLQPADATKQVLDCPQQLDAIADEINDRPRKGLGVRSPLAVYRELLINNPQHSTLVH